MLPGKKLDIATILGIVKRRLWVIVMPPAVTLFAALIYSSTIPNVYQSDMLVAIDPQRVPDAFVRSTVTLDTDLRLDAITVQVLSRTTLQQLIEKFNLYPEDRALSSTDDLVSKMRDDISIRLERPRPQWGRVPTPTAFHVLFTYTDPQIAAQVTQELGSRFVSQNVQDRGALAGATNRFLETELEDARLRLEEQERRLERFRQQHGAELPTQMQSNMQAQLNAQMRVQSIAESVVRDRDRKQILERLYREAASEPTSTATAATSQAGSSSLTDLVAAGAPAEQQLAAARTNLATLERRYTADHPDVVRMRRLVRGLEQKSAEEAARTETVTIADPPAGPSVTPAMDPQRRESLRQMLAEIESLDRQIAYKEAEERRVREEISEYQRRLEAVPGLESEWTKLTRDYDTMAASYRDLLAKSNAAEVALNLEQQEIGERFRIVDPAGVPVRPLPAVRARVNAGGFLFGLILGFGLAALLELRDASFRTDSDVLEVLALPVLASVPRIETSAERTIRVRRRLAMSVAGVMAAVAVGYVTWMLRLWNSVI